MEGLLTVACDKPILNKADPSVPFEQCFITSYDAYLAHCMYTIVVCSVFIVLRVLVFYLKQCMNI